MRTNTSAALGLTIAILLPSVLLAQAGPYERQRPDRAAVDRGRSAYAAQCINCHGLDAKGTERGPDLIRSVAVLRDRDGSEIGPAMAALSAHPARLPERDLRDLSHFLKEQVEATARNRNATTPPVVLTGNARAGRAWFDGDGGCRGCHSPEGDLAGIGARYRPVNLQQRFLFPRAYGEVPSSVTVTPPGGPPVSGSLEFVDDFFVALTDEQGVYRAFRRVPGMSVRIDDAYEAHSDLLARITDRNLHDVVTYLGTLK